MELSDAEVAILAAQSGAEVVRRAYGSDHPRIAKSHTDFATQTDLDAESAIVDLLAAHRPKDARTGEEFGNSGDQGSHRRWFIDPLCGTMNFASGTPLVAVNVALYSDNVPLVAAIADPMSNELFWTDGQRAWVRRQGHDEALTPSSISGLVEINADGPIDQPFIGGQLVSDPALRRLFGPRVISSTLGVAWAAAGRRSAYVSDGHFRDNLHFAAGIALCKAAGCVISDLNGDALHTGRGLIISGDQETHTKMLSILEPHLQQPRPTSEQQALPRACDGKYME
jgi:myo-inositol-1(or 4)-monophosphatase